MTSRARNLRNSAALSLLTVLVLSGCLDVSTSVEIEEGGSGVLSLEYSIDQRLYELGTFDGPSSEPAVPVSRRDFDLLVDAVAGARLSDYSFDVDTGDGSETGLAIVAAEIEFDSLDVLNELLGAGGGAISRTATGYQWRLFDGAGDEPVDEELVASFFGENRLEFVFRGPADVRAVDRGEWERDTARFAIALSEAVLSPEAVVWRIEM